MKQKQPAIYNENGSVLLIAVLILLLTTILGIFATNTTYIENLIAGNDKTHKQAFYNAEGGMRSVYPLLDDIRKGIDPTTFSGTYPGFNFTGNSNDFWDEAIDDDNSTSEAAPDVIVAICNNAEVDIDKLSTDITGESIINRAGYEGLGKGLATNWTAPYRVIVTGRAGSGSESQTSAKIEAIR